MIILSHNAGKCVDWCSGVVVFGVLKSKRLERLSTVVACESKCRFKSIAHMAVHAVYFLFVVYSVQFIRLIKKTILIQIAGGL
jgi:hypothetical protein